MFARTIGLPDDPVEAAAVVASRAATAIHPAHRPRRGERSVLPASTPAIGCDAALVEIDERHSELKRYAGHPLFIFAGLGRSSAATTGDSPTSRCVFDDGAVIEDAYFRL